MSQSRNGSARSARLAEDLAEDLDRLATAIDQVRAVGLSVAVPESLYRACVAIIDRYETDSVATEGSIRAVVRPAAHSEQESALLVEELKRPAGSPSLDDVPLRRLVWQTVDPEVEFTVADVVERLAGLGVYVPSNKVSNVLGYWASRGRLVRERKGTYRYPVGTAGHIKPGNLESQHVGHAGNSVTPRREEKDTSHATIAQRQAM